MQASKPVVHTRRRRGDTCSTYPVAGYWPPRCTCGEGVIEYNPSGSGAIWRAISNPLEAWRAAVEADRQAVALHKAAVRAAYDAATLSANGRPYCEPGAQGINLRMTGQLPGQGMYLTDDEARVLRDWLNTIYPIESPGGE